MVIVGWEEAEDIARINDDGRRFDLGGEHTLQCADDVLWNCAPETCIILLTSVTSINATKSKKMQNIFYLP